MINKELHKDPKPLDTQQHRTLRLQNQFSAIERIAPFTSYMVTLAEFGDASHDFPLVFVRAATDIDGKPQVAPIALFGLDRGENVFVEDGKWQADYLPAAFRSYPFTLAKVDPEGENWAVAFDASWQGFSETEGERLFDDEGKPTQLLLDVQKFAQDIEVEIERTRIAGLRLMELELLQPMRFDATLPDGQKISVDGFLTVDEKRLAALTDAQVLELHRNGLLGLLHVHRLSLANMRRLVDKRIRRQQAAAATAA